MRNHTLQLIAVCVLTFFVTLLLIGRYITKVTRDQAEYFSNHMLDVAADKMHMEGIIMRNMANGFLSIWFNPLPTSDPVAPNGLNGVRYVIDDREIEAFRRDVYDDMRNLLQERQRQDISCHFIISPGVYPSIGDRLFVPYVYAGGDYATDLGDSVNYRKDTIMKVILSNKKPFWYCPDSTAAYGAFGLSYYTPLERENGETFGAFSINVGYSLLDKVFSRFLPYGPENSAFLILEGDGRLMHSLGSKKLSASAVKCLPEILAKPDGSSFCSETYDFFARVKPYGDDGRKIVGVCSSDILYKHSKKVVSVVLLIALIGIILMSFFTYLVLRRVSREHKDRLSAENALRLAASVQEKMLKAPCVSESSFLLKAWFKPAFETGGDLYDYVQKEGRLIFIIGDVSGKGISAAMFMTQVCSLFRSWAAMTDDTEKIVSGINSVLSKDNETNTFCTLIAGSLDLSSGRLELCNAGHTMPVMSPVGGEPHFLNLNHSLPVAIDEDSRFVANIFNMAPGDALLLYSDGVTEARGAEHQFFGSHRLIASLTGQVPGDYEALLTDLKGFSSGIQQSDDITLLSCRYLGSLS